MSRLFEVFSQTASGQQSQEGTGLGLPISRKFIELMGGTIQVQSQVGQGTIFQFDIWAKESAPSEITKRAGQNEKRVIALEPDQPQYRVLIVDDKWTNRQLLIKLLKPLGFALREAENGQEAIEIWQKFEPHLIWMDMRMPVLDGYEATRRIKATTQGQATVVIALTASAFEEERAIVLSAGCDDFMRKPFREAQIFQMMSKHIGVRYIYEDIAADAPALGKKLDTQTLKAALSTLPASLRIQLVEGVELGDMQMIEATIADIGPHNPDLAIGLSSLADNFEYDKILNLLQREA
jgi:CheY-like chemotaxis protein